MLTQRKVFRRCVAAATAIIFASGCFFFGSALGQQPVPAGSARTADRKQSEANRVASNLRRDWLRKQLPKLIRDPRELSQALDRVDRASDDEVNDLANACLEELRVRREQQFNRLRETNAREREFREKLAETAAAAPTYAASPPAGFFPHFGVYPGLGGYPGFGYFPGFGCYPGVAYAPIVGWFPEGVSLSAQGVVSPDRRSVRLSLAPFFSRVGPVYTFNYMTGETRRLPQYDPPPPPSIKPPVTLPDLRGR